MKIEPTAIAGVVRVDPAPYADPRGVFTRLFCERELEGVAGGRRIVQVNHSRTRAAGTIRGLHFQYPPHAEMKMVRCLKGRIWDVAVDLRAGSPTFLAWHAEELTPGSPRMLVIPEGCAHGFQTLADDSEILYFCTAFYEPSAEGGVRWDDPRLAIRWPLPAGELSARDRAHAPLPADYAGIVP